MNIKKWIYLFFTTLLIGGITTIVIGFILRPDDINGLGNIAFTAIWLMGYGFLFSLFSQMGFFSYLTIHRFGLGIFKSVRLWNWVQVLLIILVLFDLIYFRSFSFTKTDTPLVEFIGVPIILIVCGLIVAWLKSKETNKHAFIPTLFLMVVITTIELIIVLQQSDTFWVWLTIAPLLACNTWQVMLLHRLINKKD